MLMNACFVKQVMYECQRRSYHHCFEWFDTKINKYLINKYLDLSIHVFCLSIASLIITSEPSPHLLNSYLPILNSSD